jgi:hypothetical protein
VVVSPRVGEGRAAPRSEGSSRALGRTATTNEPSSKSVESAGGGSSSAARRSCLTAPAYDMRAGCAAMAPTTFLGAFTAAAASATSPRTAQALEASSSAW